MSQRGRQRSCELSISEYVGPLGEAQVRSHDDRLPLIAVGRSLEIEDLKKKIFMEPGQSGLKETPLAINTSSIHKIRLAEASQHPERILGLHFLPVHLMGLVEVVKGEKTSWYRRW